jgi:hypothetical protein
MLKIPLVLCCLLCWLGTVIGEQSPAPAEHKIVRSGYSLKYQADWELDTADMETDMDSYFTINSSNENTFVSFSFFKQPIDEAAYLAQQVSYHLNKTMKYAKVNNFDTYGQYKGKGARIRGKILGLLDGEIEIFVRSSEGISFLVVSQVFESDIEMDMSGIRLIETSFRLKSSMQ